MTKNKKLIIVYTGDGKGKTSAAIGTAMRTLLHGGAVAMVQFIKNPDADRTAISKLPALIDRFSLYTMGRGFTWKSDDINKDKEAAKQAWEKSKELLERGQNNLVILDEILYAIDSALIAEEELLSFLQTWEPKCHLVLTGRNASAAVIEAADLVSEIQNRKHPFEKGILAQKGIDW